MTRPYTKVSTRRTPQSQPILGSAQIANSAGGYSFAIDDWKQLDRFLILGTEGGTYYIGEAELTLANAEAVMRCIQADGPRVVDQVVKISQSGRAPKNDPALFVLALAASKGDAMTKIAALGSLPLVARTGTHLFHFAQYVEQFRGWGRGLRRAIGAWYTSKSPIALVKQVTKYAQRDGWTHRDLLRLAHVTPPSDEYNAIFKYVVKGVSPEPESPYDSFAYLDAVETVKGLKDNPVAIARYVEQYKLPREVLPTKALNEAIVWEALLPQMGLTAMIRNLGNMSKIGLLKPMSAAEARVLVKLSDREALKNERVHPLQILLAQSVYAAGHGLRGSGSWTPTPRVIDALNDAFYAAFDSVEPSGKRVLLSLDVSGSMSMGQVGGTPLTPREAAAAMALVTARTEPQYGIMAFADQFVPLNISPRDRLDTVVKKTASIGMMGTDCAAPMLWALGVDYPAQGCPKKRDKIVEVDTFVIYTDSETWFGNVHPVQALQMYREHTGIPAKLVVVGMTANKFSIADPNDSGMLDVVGFDASAPAVIADFMRD